MLPCAGCRIVSQIACETWNGWDEDDDSELPPFLAGVNDSIDNSASDLVVNWVLCISGGGNYGLSDDMYSCWYA